MDCDVAGCRPTLRAWRRRCLAPSHDPHRRPRPSSRCTCRSSAARAEPRGREWRPGEAIPSEIELAARFGVSQGTVRKAIDALAADNLRRAPAGQGHVRRDAHRGAGVACSASCASAATTASDEYPASRLLDVRRGKAGAEIARAARRSSPAMRCIVLRRVLDYAGEPSVLDEITLPAALFRGLTKARYDAYRGSMYGFFETAVRRAHAEGAGNAARGRRRRGERAILGVAAGDAAAGGRPRHAHLRRSAGRIAPRPVRDARAITISTSCG